VLNPRRFSRQRKCSQLLYRSAPVFQRGQDLHRNVPAGLRGRDTLRSVLVRRPGQAFARLIELPSDLLCLNLLRCRRH